MSNTNLEFLIIILGEEVVPMYPIFGVKHEKSLQNAAKMKIVHPTITTIAEIRKRGMFISLLAACSPLINSRDGYVWNFQGVRKRNDN